MGFVEIDNVFVAFGHDHVTGNGLEIPGDIIDNRCLRFCCKAGNENEHQYQFRPERS